MRGATINKRLLALRDRAPEIAISDADRLVIFSDIHMGDGGRQDDFLRNGPMFRTVLERYYEQKEFRLILNGDIEELQRFYPGPIYDKWVDIYEILGRFKDRGALYKLAGNHDLELLVKKRNPLEIPIHESLRLVYNDSDILLLHGHQAYRYVKAFILLSGLLLRFVANPLGIKNYSVAFNSRKKYRVERRVYRFAKSRKVLAVIGHTHRPLFESLSRQDRLKFHIEQLCRLYPQAERRKKESGETNPGEQGGTAGSDFQETQSGNGGAGESLSVRAGCALSVQLRVLHRQERNHGSGNRGGAHGPGSLVRPAAQQPAFPGGLRSGSRRCRARLDRPAPARAGRRARLPATTWGQRLFPGGSEQRYPGLYLQGFSCH